MRILSTLILVVALFTLSAPLTSCASAPVNLSPAGATAFNKTRVVKALDLVRDTAIAANAQTPPLLSTDETRQIVTFHEATLKTLQATDEGWQAAVSTAVTEFAKTLSSAQQKVLAPYLTLLQTLIAGIS